MIDSTNEVLVLGAARTAIGSFGGSLKDVSPTELGAHVTRVALERAGVDAEEVQSSVLGHVIRTESKDSYIGRRVALGAGLPNSAQSLTLNRLCGSGLEAIVFAAQQLQLGEVDVAVAGGAESMSRSGHLMTSARWGQRMGDAVATDEMMSALTDPFNDYHMGITAENLAEKYQLSREAQDEFAAESQRRAAAASDAGYFREQIAPYEIKTRKGSVIFDTDEHVRGDTTTDALSGLRPAFKRDGGTVTAGNASGINDGAAMIVLASASRSKALGAKPLARLVSYGRCGVPPEIMGIGPVGASQTALQRAGLSVDDLDVIESNEAFAAQAMSVANELKLPAERTNPNGGAIALGHPVGASGAVLTTKAIYELHRTGGRYALVTLCIGGGQGIAAIFERL